MCEYLSREAVFQVIHGKARGISGKYIEALSAKDTRVFYKAKGAKEILDSVATDLCYVPVADVQLVKRGEWEDERYDDLLGCYIATCSECGYESTDRYRITDNHRHCEYCGAIMDLKDGDTNG